jgi:hypothetical protein
VASAGWQLGGSTETSSGPRTSWPNLRHRMLLSARGKPALLRLSPTKPWQSWMLIPLGESDHSDSPHFDDQAEKLFSRAQVKPNYFLRRDELKRHVIAENYLTY